MQMFLAKTIGSEAKWRSKKFWREVHIQWSKRKSSMCIVTSDLLKWNWNFEGKVRQWLYDATMHFTFCKSALQLLATTASSVLLKSESSALFITARPSRCKGQDCDLLLFSYISVCGFCVETCCKSWSLELNFAYTIEVEWRLKPSLYWKSALEMRNLVSVAQHTQAQIVNAGRGFRSNRYLYVQVWGQYLLSTPCYDFLKNAVLLYCAFGANQMNSWICCALQWL